MGGLSYPSLGHNPQRTGCRCHFKVDLCSSRGLIDSFNGVLKSSVATKIFALEYELRGIDGARAIDTGDLSLPFGELALRKAIWPAQIVPIIHMKCERDHAISMKTHCT